MRHTDLALNATAQPATDTVGFAGDQNAAAQGMFVAVGTDKATGRAIIALDAAAVDALTGLLDRSVNSDDLMYPDDDTDRASSVVAPAILRPLLKLQGYLA